MAYIEIDPQTGAVVPPLHLASTFRQPGAGQWGEFDYSRSGNPTVRALEQKIAALENGADCTCYSTGMAAEQVVLIDEVRSQASPSPHTSNSPWLSPWSAPTATMVSPSRPRSARVSRRRPT
mgnify:CR=1 FL=1